jgi:alkylation response protein AidB-like acyl-CoA dehydrogenase
MGFRAPLADILFTMRHIADLDGVIAADGTSEVSPEMVEAILQAAGRFAEIELDPINRAGDQTGCRLADGAVTTPPGWREAYRAFAEAGWNGVTASADWGGQDLPVMVHTALQELWNAGAASFAVGPMLTMSAIEALEAHASDEIKARYLPKLVAGTWMATMNLTEPHAGSDVGALRSCAERADDGTYRVFGQKIFITYGEHDLAENIIHLVLARLPDAPPGTAGISLFLVPKFLPDQNGAPGKRNDLVCAGIEHKLGLHGSPTCTMSYGDKGGGAIGWLVGEENRGLAAMFTMMNIARLTVGVQGIGIATRAFDRALAYAHERKQGRAVGAPAGTSSPIVEHPDVQRDLLRMKALTAASRAIAMLCAEAIDRSRRAPQSERAFWAERAGLLTPIAKAFSTDAGIEVASLGIQVHGGAGYIEETGAAQYLRDGRIFAIYEGTNGIQAIDLVTRKLRLSDGKAVEELLGDFAGIAQKAAALNRPDFGSIAAHLEAALGALSDATAFLITVQAEGRLPAALAGATPYLRLFGLTAGGVLLTKGALHAAEVADGDGWISLARFFAENALGETVSLAKTVIEGAEALQKAADTHLLEPTRSGLTKASGFL